MARRILDRDGTITPKEIDKGIKNIWKWAWLERGVWRACQSSHSEARREGKGFLYTVGKIYPMLHKDGRLWNNTSN
jgi:hypothetical protein